MRQRTYYVEMKKTYSLKKTVKREHLKKMMLLNVEQGFTDLVDAESELFMELERDRHNTPICKLILATASDLQWNCITGQSITRKYKK